MFEKRCDTINNSGPNSDKQKCCRIGRRGGGGYVLYVDAVVVGRFRVVWIFSAAWLARIS